MSSTPSLTTWPRAGRLADALSALARSTVNGQDTVDLLSDLATQCVAVLPIDAAGILVTDQFSTLRVIGSSSDAAHLLDLYQVQNEEGPCMECLTTGAAISIDDLAAPAAPWPHFRATALREGFTSVYAIPLSSKGTTLGALNLFSQNVLTSLDLQGAQSLADAATLSLLRADPTDDAVLVAQRLHRAIETRNSIEQAKGMMSQRRGIPIDQAFEVLQALAAGHHLSLGEVAHLITTRSDFAE